MKSLNLITIKKEEKESSVKVQMYDNLENLIIEIGKKSIQRQILLQMIITMIHLSRVLIMRFFLRRITTLNSENYQENYDYLVYILLSVALSYL